MRVLILFGSFRPDGNTSTLLKPFINELKNNGVDITTISVCEKNIAPCNACWTCQNIQGKYGCSKNDDMYGIVDEILRCDCVIFATPIYTWYCTPQMKALLDRHYGLNKFYGDFDRSSLWAGKKCGIVATCGYDIEYGVSPFEDGIKRLCEHSGLVYIGKLAVRDTDDRVSFETNEAVSKAISYAKTVIASLSKHN